MTSGAFMKKNTKAKKITYYNQSDEVGKMEEPAAFYKNIKVIPVTKDFTYTEFKKFADKTPLTQAEWASVLHISERTLQRYAKSNGIFSFINAERFYQVMQVIERGKKVFGKIESFYNWLHSNPPMLEGELSFASLNTFDGIQKILTQLGRIEHGILA